MQPHGPTVSAERYSNPNDTQCVLLRSMWTELVKLMGLDAEKTEEFIDSVWTVETKLAKVMVHNVILRRLKHTHRFVSNECDFSPSQTKHFFSPSQITPLPHDQESLDPTMSYNKLPLRDLKANYSYVRSALM